MDSSNTLKLTAVFAAIVVITIAAPAFSAGQAGTRSRGLIVKNYETGKTDGIRVLIYKVNGDDHAPVDPASQFTKGDEITVAFESNFDGYVYVVNVTPGGKKRVLFPGFGEANNMVKARQRYELPSNGTFAFDAEKGTETLQVIMAKQPIGFLDDAVKNSKGELGNSAASAADELGANRAGGSDSGIVAENVAMLLPKDQPGIRPRGLDLAPGKDKDEGGSVVAIQDDSGKTGGKLKQGDVAVFEIRLKHI